MAHETKVAAPPDGAGRKAAPGARRGRPPANEADTAKQILDCAERLFAQRGIEATSLREIAAGAGQRNSMAVQYHFGSKDGLVRAIFKDRVARMEPARRMMLDRARREGLMKDARTLLEILHLPYLDLVDEHGNHVYAAFLAGYIQNQRPRGLLHPVDRRETQTEALYEVLHLLARRSDYVPPQIAESRLAIVNAMFLNMLIRHNAERGRGASTIPLADLVEDTLNIMTAAFCEPAPRIRSDWIGWREGGDADVP